MNSLMPESTPERTTLAKIFLSPEEPRLRAGWRILIHTIGYNFLLICLTIPAIVPVLVFGVSPRSLWLNEIIAVLAVTPAVFLARRFLDRRSIVSLGLKPDRQMIFDLLAGIVITFVMMGIIFGLEMTAGWLTIESFAWQSESISRVALSMTGVFLLFILVAWQEELLFRGYRLQNIEEGMNPIWGIILSSLWFGAGHSFNPNATIISVVGIFLAGIFLAYGYQRTGQLWLPIGLHLGWNFFEGVVFGFPVSGLDVYRMIRVQINGSDLWTGGAFGPEAGLVLLPALLVGAGLISIYTRGRHARETGGKEIQSQNND
jgi:membrane protease YdiL (CAAX protease family)